MLSFSLRVVGAFLLLSNTVWAYAATPSHQLRKSPAERNMESGKTATLRVNTGPLTFGLLSGSLTYKLSEKLALGPSLGLGTWGWGLGWNTAVALGADSHIAITGASVLDDGWYAAPYGRYLMFPGALSGGWGILSLGSVGGYQWNVDKDVSVRAGAGLAMHYVSSSFYASGFGVSPSLELSVGYNLF